MTTFQPCPIGPTTMSAGVRASVKNTSLNSAVPVIWVIGRISTPGWSTGHSRKLIPSCFFAAVGSVRQTTKIQSAMWPRLVHTF